MSKEEIADYALAILRPLVPEGLDCAVRQDEMGVLFTISVPDEHKGRVIGKGGENVHAVRKLVALVGYTHGMRASIKIV